MPKKIKSALPTSSSTTLALSEMHILSSLEKEHHSLIKQTKRKRTELNDFVEQMRSLATEIFQKATPSFKKIADLDQENYAVFNEILTTTKFRKQTKKV